MESKLLSANQGFGPVLRNSRFLFLWVGQIFSQLADKFYLVLMIALIANHYQAENQSISGWVSAIMIANTIPAVLFGSLAGVYVDRWQKKQVLVISNFCRGLLILLLPFLLWVGDRHDINLPVGWLPSFLRRWQTEEHQYFALPLGFAILLAVTFAVSTLTQFFAPAEQSATPLVVRRRNLLAANSLTTLTMMGVLIIGFAIGEPLLTLADSLFPQAGDVGPVLVVASCYLVAGIVLLMLKTGEKQADPDLVHPHVLSDIQDGIRYLQENHRVRNALIQLLILFSIFAALSVLAVSMAAHLPGLKASQFGFLLAFGGLGMAIGALSIGYIGQRFSPTELALWGSLGMGVCLAGLALFDHSLVLTFVTITIMGFFAAMVGVPMQTLMQVETDPEFHGKVFGLENNANNIALSLPLALAGVAESLFGLTPVLLFLAAAAIAGGVLSWYINENSPPVAPRKAKGSSSSS
ncbi:MFS transporter [Synechocystis sp. LEGE 06083]|uniref:MFS transporter n=2 Tax=unclassified Synechocystis TaxID=2640012 RepID=UPI00187F46FF|nr:MFS transporter [Synechocystis sp. LEGE 06083]MBE9194389.1 MFS transporter [Synechocystis sp. LEGE 06083]